MAHLSDYIRQKAFVPKGKGDKAKLKRLGRLHMTVFSPRGDTVVGFLIRRPDVAGMVRRPDVFVALDSLSRVEDGFQVSDERGAIDDAARRRLGIDWDRCLMWEGMDAVTTDGGALGYVSDAEFDPATGKVSLFCVGDGGVAESLVGTVHIPAAQVRGYRDGMMVVSNEAQDYRPSGGVAGKAGTAYAKAKVKGAQTAKKADDVASRAVDKGSKALGKQLGKTKGMFGSFMDEYRKASR